MMWVARHHLRRDPVMAQVISRVGPCRMTLRSEGTHFQALVRSIVYQQLSTKAAATIHGRLAALLGEITPATVLAAKDTDLRGAGLSGQKLGYLQDLARRVAGGEVLLDDVERLRDDDILEQLTSVKGIGRWTVQMFLMFRLGRPDILATGDLGIQNAIQKAWELPERPSPTEVARIGAAWSPHSSIACWYLWRSLDAPP
jgi:DNA-3-methyladenine glycosylase II